MHKVPVLTGRHRELFWQKVAKGDGCWNWTGGRYDGGYGMVRYQKKNFNAHRLSYAMAHGGVPDGMVICHKCDNPSCVNPEHLFAGTYQDNVDDMIRKGRKVACDGMSNGQAELTDEQVIAIRKRYAVGDITHKELSKQYAVSPAEIGMITQGKTWSHIGGPRTNGMAIRDERPSKISGEKNHNAKLTASDVEAMRKRYANGGVTMKQLGKLFGICAQTVCGIIHGKKWKHIIA